MKKYLSSVRKGNLLLRRLANEKEGRKNIMRCYHIHISSTWRGEGHTSPGKCTLSLLWRSLSEEAWQQEGRKEKERERKVAGRRGRATLCPAMSHTVVWGKKRGVSVSGRRKRYSEEENGEEEEKKEEDMWNNTAEEVCTEREEKRRRLGNPYASTICSILGKKLSSACLPATALKLLIYETRRKKKRRRQKRKGGRSISSGKASAVTISLYI